MTSFKELATPVKVAVICIVAAIVLCCGTASWAIFSTGSKPAPRPTGTVRPIPTSTPIAPVTLTPTPPPATAPAPTPAPVVPAPAPVAPRTDPKFGTCAEAKSHGYGPYQRGVDVEYGWYRDQDNDGLACE